MNPPAPPTSNSSSRPRWKGLCIILLALAAFNLTLFRFQFPSSVSLLSATERALQKDTSSTFVSRTSETASDSKEDYYPSKTPEKEEDDQPQHVDDDSQDDQESHDDSYWQREVQEASVAALEKMKKRRALTTSFATRESTLSKGFPSQWNPCTIHSLLNQKRQNKGTNNDPLRVVVLGGSCSARAADNCTAEDSDDPLTGRYSDIVQQALDDDSQSLFLSRNLESHLEFDFVNMAQGHTNSILNGLTLDTLVDPTKTDLLIWEFTPNENWGFRARDPHKIQFWLARVQSLFQRAGRPLPPILMMFLWERNIGLPEKLPSLVQHGLDHTVNNALPFVEYYKQEHNWNIQVLSVGSTVSNPAAVAQNTKLLLDDVIHPACHTMHHMADMIQHAIYTNLATCSSGDPNDNPHASARSTVQPQSPPVPKVEGKDHIKSIFDLIMNPKAQVASLTAWEPQAGLSNLAISLQANWTTTLTAKVHPNRADRKLGYTLPHCDRSSPQQWPNITVLEPHLQWLGIGVTKKGAIRAFLNGAEVPAEEDASFQWDLGMHYVKRWIPVMASNNNTLTLCDAADKEWRPTRLTQLVGIMMDSANIDVSEALAQ